jgi:prefoldin subunit 5
MNNETVRIKIDRYKKELDTIQRAYDKEKGRHQTLVEQLKKRFDVGTVEDAKKMLKKKQNERDKLETEMEEMLKTYESKYV